MNYTTHVPPKPNIWILAECEYLRQGNSFKIKMSKITFSQFHVIKFSIDINDHIKLNGIIKKQTNNYNNKITVIILSIQWKKTTDVKRVQQS